MAIVKANYRPRAKVGRIGRSVTYYTWREDRENPRSWQSSDGRELDYEQAWREITDQAHESGYTYRIILSTRAVALGDDDYARVLDGQFDRWYFVTHAAGDHPHAHAIAFADRRLGVGELREMREDLLERELARERQLERDADLARER